MKLRAHRKDMRTANAQLCVLLQTPSLLLMTTVASFTPFSFIQTAYLVSTCEEARYSPHAALGTQAFPSVDSAPFPGSSARGEGRTTWRSQPAVGLRESGRLGAGACLSFADRRRQVVAHGALGQPERPGDVGHGAALDGDAQHVRLALG